MPTKIRRSLFVGLGGTGMKSLLHTKKMFVETYGEVPPMIGFLGIDTNLGEYKTVLESSYGEVKLEPSEQLQIIVREDPQPLFFRHPARFAWIPQENLKHLRSMETGAGQIRSNGRFAIIYNEYNITNRIQHVINQLLNVDHTYNPKYELISSNLEIHVVFSLCGGTGSGTFINTAYLLRQVAPEAFVYAYAVLPGVFEAEINSFAAKAKIMPNGYGSLLDLDYLMHLNMGVPPINIDYLTKTDTTQKNPFDSVYLIDNKNENNGIYDKVDDLAQMISLALITATGELSIAQTSVFDNVKRLIKDGAMNIGNKIAWVAGFGVCEICYNAKSLRDILTLKTMVRLIERLENPNADANNIANAWIDTNHIRENNGKDDVIDHLCSKTPRIPFDSINTPAAPKAEVDSYIDNIARERPDQIREKVDELISSIKNSLKELMIKEINKEGGIGNCLNIIQAINSQISICLSEMQTELDDFKQKAPVFVSQKETTSQELADHMTKFIKNKKQQYIDAVVDAVNMYAINLREIDRRNGAIQFYTWLKTELDNQKTTIENIKTCVDSIKGRCEKSIATIQYRVTNTGNTFQIDLARNEANNISYNDEAIVISDFVGQISLSGDIYSFAQLRTDEIEHIIADYSNTLTEQSGFTNMSVDQMLRKLNPTELNNILKEAVVKSEPLIKYNSRGHIAPIPPEKYFYIGVEDNKASVLVQDNLFANMLTNRHPEFSSIGLKDKIIIYCQYGNMPVFTVDPVPSYELKYNEVMKNTNCHFGADLLARMQRESFSIYPKEETSNTIELWVKGLIFGLIKNDGNSYSFRCEQEGDIIDNFWVILPADRYDAYKEFKNHQIALEKEYEDYFDELIKQKGKEEIEKIIIDAKQNYEEKYAQLNMTREQLKRKGYELDLNLYREELTYVNKELSI